MAVQYAPAKLKVPPGFQNLLEGLAREVLREQPDNIINFAANYFKNQLAIRNETGQDDAKKGADMEALEREEEIDIDLDDPSTKHAATKIQAVFRGHQTRREAQQKKKEDDAATKIQAGFRGHQARKSVKAMQSAEVMDGDADENAAVGEEGKEQEEYVQKVTENEDAEEIRDFEDPRYDEAATRIQAGFRGYKTREDLKERLSQENTQEGSKEEKDEKDDAESKEEEAAAVKIQASFRGHQARKEVEAMKSSQSEEAVTSKDDADDDLDARKSEEAAVKIQAGYRGYVARKEVESLKASASKDETAQDNADDAETKKSEEAAVKIQAGYRGYVARKEVEAMKTSKSEENAQGTEDDLDTKKSEEAAVKIQAGFRGYVARKEVEAIKSSKSQEGSSESKDEDVDKEQSNENGGKTNEDDEEQEKAAIRIQASYRGYKTRASLKMDSAPQLEGESITKSEGIKEEEDEAEG